MQGSDTSRRQPVDAERRNHRRFVFAVEPGQTQQAAIQ
jgi:hypothetical protein